MLVKIPENETELLEKTKALIAVRRKRLEVLEIASPLDNAHINIIEGFLSELQAGTLYFWGNHSADFQPCGPDIVQRVLKAIASDRNRIQNLVFDSKLSEAAFRAYAQGLAEIPKLRGIGFRNVFQPGRVDLDFLFQCLTKCNLASFRISMSRFERATLNSMMTSLESLTIQFKVPPRNSNSLDPLAGPISSMKHLKHLCFLPPVPSIVQAPNQLVHLDIRDAITLECEPMLPLLSKIQIHTFESTFNTRPSNLESLDVLSESSISHISFSSGDADTICRVFRALSRSKSIRRVRL